MKGFSLDFVFPYFLQRFEKKSGEICVVFAQPIPHMVPSCNVTIRSPYIISPALDGPYMRGSSSQFVVTIVVCSSATYGRTFIQAIHRSRVAYAVLKRHIRPICVRVRISGLIILFSHILLHSKTPEQCPKTRFLKSLLAKEKIVKMTILPGYCMCFPIFLPICAS